MTEAALRRPAGAQHVICHGDQRATVVQVGGGLREYEVAGFPVLDGFGEDEMAGSGRGQVLQPWPNRLAGGRYEFAGQTLQVPLSEPDKGNAIHGLVRWSGWNLLEGGASRVRLGHVLWAQAGYPFTLALELEYELSDAGLRVTMRSENAGRGPAPYGAGMHPYVRADLGGIDGATLRLQAEQWLEADERQVPTGRVLSVAGTGYDFREPRGIGRTRIDTAFTGLGRDSAGIARAELRSGDGGRLVTVWMDGHFDYLMLFTGDTLAEGERRRSLGVEPMTCAPDAFNSGLGLLVLEPGEQVSGSWGITVR
ncbi:MAG TPA: aldose 1-epimerase family protein [Candidatus Eisenbacteria bacterium]|nr:aldose 1-epimerase family protein [Candidatus Eisenbacteria bacterium]